MAKKKGKSEQAMVKQGLRFQIIGFFKELLLVFACVLVINGFVMAAFKVPTASMEDTVQAGDFLFVNRFIYGGSTPYTIPLTSIRIPHFRVPGFRGIRHGDVIVFDWPGSRDQVKKPEQVWYLKRCVGVPGDTIRIVQREVYVNGRKQENPPNAKFLRAKAVPDGYWNPDIFPRGSGFNEDNYGPIVVPQKGSILPLNAAGLPAWEVLIRREGHTVSLAEGGILIDGRPAAEYEVERDYIFAMGDNRDDSRDSRFWGFVPVEDVVGTPMIVFWSWDPQTPLYHPIEKLLSVKPGRIGTVIR